MGEGYGWVRKGPICQAREIRHHPVGRRHFMGDFVEDGFRKEVGLEGDRVSMMARKLPLSSP